jgi:hypothetical protein
MLDPRLLDRLEAKYRPLEPLLNERLRRLWAAVEARDIGPGGTTAVAQVTGLSRMTVWRGMKELKNPDAYPALDKDRARQPRPSDRRGLLQRTPKLLLALNKLIRPLGGSAEAAPFRWTCLSTKQLARRLSRKRRAIGPRSVAALLFRDGFSLSGHRRSKGRKADSRRNAQFESINKLVPTFWRSRQPVIHITLKISRFSGESVGSASSSSGTSKRTKPTLDDRLNAALKTIIPPSKSDLLTPCDWLAAPIDSANARFVANAIRQWWGTTREDRFPRAKKLLVIADGVSDRHLRSWQTALQQLVELGLTIRVAHMLPATVKCNCVEQQLAVLNLHTPRGRPGFGWLATVSTIAELKDNEGPRIEARLDRTRYLTKIDAVATDDEKRAHVRRCKGDEKWNYIISSC